MKRRTTQVFAILFSIAVVQPLHAQLFGHARQLGVPLQRQQGSGVAAQPSQDAGQIQGNERFLRSNRRRNDFVGADRFEGRGFVGSEQGRTSGPLLQSTVGVRPAQDRSRQINQPLPNLPRNQMYYPALQPDFEVRGVGIPELLKRDLENPAYFEASNRYEVLVEGRRATLRGVVADARQRDLAEILVSFEPGISEVVNELEVLPAPNPLVRPGLNSEN